MKNICMPFLLRGLKRWGIFTAAMLIVCVISEKVFGFGWWGSTLPLIMSFILYAMNTPDLGFSRNVSWMLALPRPRTQLMGAKYLLSVAHIAMFGISMLLVSLCVAAMNMDLSQVKWTTALENIFTKDLVDDFGLFRVSVIGWMGFVFIHMMAIAPGPGLLKDKTFGLASFRSYLKSHNIDENLALLIIAIPLLIVGFLLREYLFAGFVIISLITVFSLLVFTYSGLKAFVVPKSTSFSLMSVMTILTLAGIIGIYFTAQRRLHIGTPQEKLASVRFLGAFSPELAREEWTKILYSGLDEDDAKFGIQIYAKKFGKNGKITFNENEILEPGKLFSAGKSYFWQWNSVNYLSLRKEHLDSFISEIDKKKMKGDYFIDYVRRFSHLDFSEKELTERLTSEKELEILLGLHLARFFGGTKTVKVIEKNLLHYSEENRLYALKTLSLITGKEVGTNAFIDLSKGRSIANLTAAKVDCQQFDNLNEEQAVDVFALNHCIYRSAYRVARYEWDDPSHGFLRKSSSPKEIQGALKRLKALATYKNLAAKK